MHSQVRLGTVGPLGQFDRVVRKTSGQGGGKNRSIRHNVA